jgi:thioredoxin-like negative regulator of GroEL
MIERLLAAEGALARDELDHAKRLFEQVAEADPRNAIAVVGLARIAARRGDTAGARAGLEHALEIDPDEAAARRLLRDLESPAAAFPPAPPPLEAQPAGTAPSQMPEPGRVRPHPSLLDRLLALLGIHPRG